MSSMTTPLATADVPSDRNSGMRRWGRHRWTLYVILGALLSIYEGLNEAIGSSNHYPTWKPFVWGMSSVFVIFALIPLVARFEARFRIDARPRTRAVLIHSGAGVAFSAIH